MNNIKQFISQKKWESIISSYSVKDICSLLSFSEAMHLVEHLFYDDIHDDTKQQYALKLAFELKEYFKNEWDCDWKNDIFLGDLCEMLWLYDERYLYYKRAYDKLENPPAELLLLLSGCNSAPGSPPITDEESEYYLREAIKKKITSESAFLMRILYKQKGNESQTNYWDEMYQKLEKEGVHSEQLIPDVLKE